MTQEQQELLVNELKSLVLTEFPLSTLSDEQLQNSIEELVDQRLAGQYVPIDRRVEMVRQIYSSIRGFGVLDTIMSDDTITMLSPDLYVDMAVPAMAKAGDAFGGTVFHSCGNWSDKKADIVAIKNIRKADGPCAF